MKPSVKKFEDLEVWKTSMELASAVYKSVKPLRDYGLKDQMQRAAISIPSNIAEGYERNSNKEFIQQLFIAKGSCGELRTQIYFCIASGFLDSSSGDELLEQTRKVSAMLYKLIAARKLFNVK